MSKPMGHRVAIIGAGFGGLSAAIELASRGIDVEVFEKNNSSGGKAAEIEVEGFRFDTGPSLLTMPFVLDALYAAAGRERAIELIPVDPVCRYMFADGSVLDAWSDENRFIEAVREIAPGDAASIAGFLDYSERIYNLTSEIFLFNRLDDFRNLFRAKNLKTLFQFPRIDPFRSVHSAVTSHFRDPRMVQLFDRYATYNGSNPFKAPATLNIIPHVEYRIGGYYVRGGMYALVRSLTQLALDLGVRIHYGANVTSIVQSGRSVCGIRVDDRELKFDAVISNADAVYTLTSLLDDAPGRRRYAAIEPSCSGLVFLWGIREKHEQLRHHNIYFSGDYGKEFREIFDLQIPPRDPTVYVSITAKSEPGHAPDGMENWFVLVNMPALTAANRDLDIDAMREIVLRKLAAAGADVKEKILVERVIKPADLATRFNAHRGSIYGISSNSPKAAFIRPRNRVRGVQGLYLCGGAAHPGGGVPLVILSGKHAANSFLQDIRRQ